MKNKESLIKELENCTKRVKEIKEILLSMDNGFDNWLKYAEKEDYSFLISEKKAPIFYKYFIDIRGFDRYSTVNIEDVLDWLDDCEEELIEKSDDENIIDKIQQELIDLNFGSMEFDW
jgi:hypothetical protein